MSMIVNNRLPGCFSISLKTLKFKDLNAEMKRLSQNRDTLRAE